jgi:hypothetical protein
MQTWHRTCCVLPLDILSLRRPGLPRHVLSPLAPPCSPSLPGAAPTPLLVLFLLVELATLTSMSVVTTSPERMVRRPSSPVISYPRASPYPTPLTLTIAPPGRTPLHPRSRTRPSRAVVLLDVARDARRAVIALHLRSASLPHQHFLLVLTMPLSFARCL